MINFYVFIMQIHGLLISVYRSFERNCRHDTSALKRKSASMSYFYSSSFVESLGRQHLHSVLPEHAWLLCALHNSDSNRVWLFIDSTRKSISIRACWICCMYTDHVICLSWHWGKNCLHNIFTIVAICLIKKKKERRKKKSAFFFLCSDSLFDSDAVVFK